MSGNCPDCGNTICVCTFFTIPPGGGAPEVAAAATAATSRQPKSDYERHLSRDVRQLFAESHLREGGKWLRQFVRAEYRHLLDIEVPCMLARGTLTRSVRRGLSHAPLITAPTPDVPPAPVVLPRRESPDAAEAQADGYPVGLESEVAWNRGLTWNRPVEHESEAS